MGAYQIIILSLSLFWMVQLSAIEPDQIVYWMHTGHAAKAFQGYQQYKAESGCHDFALLERLGLILLDQGHRVSDAETKLLTLYGAGISLNEKALYIIEDALHTGEPELQLIALNLMERIHHDRTDQLLHRAMRSDYLLIRLEAAWQLAAKRDPKAVSLIEALMLKLPEQLHLIFPQFFALIDNQESKKVLRKMLTQSKEPVRIAAVLSIIENGHDDFLPAIRRLSAQHGIGQQEACAYALGVFKDGEGRSRLTALCKNPHTNIRLAALRALYQMGQEEVRQIVEELAKQDLFAINLLGEMRGSEPLLVELLQSPSTLIRLNAAMSLLELKDARCLPILAALLLKDKKDLAIYQISSPGKSLHAWKIIPSATQNLQEDPTALELSLHLRESLIAKAVELPEKEFIALADLLFTQRQNDLVPALIQTLENHASEAAIALLKKHQQKAGAPLIRNYCNLALYRLKQPGPYGELLHNWVIKQRDTDLIRFRPLLSWDAQASTHSTFEVTPEETSRLLVEAFESFVSTQDDKGLDTLISLMQSGNAKNKYALVGLLMRAIQ